MLKIVLAVVALGVLGVLALAAMRPDDFRVERRMLVKAPPEKLFPYIDNLRGFDQWSPYKAKDAQLKGSFSGPEAGPGAKYEWVGNAEVGQGSMEIKSHQPNAQVLVEMVFIKPFAGINTVEFGLTPKAGGTEVSWAIYGPQAFIPKLMGMFFNMDKMIGTDFEKGLDNLRKLAEAG
jgi:Polyketide cyclase / dehydrase and lipid transport